MKFRTDFVTNSSSSSFIISTNNEVPEKYKNWVKEITIENIFETLREMGNYWDDEYSFHDHISNKRVQELCKLTDEQLQLVILANNGMLEKYFEVLNMLNISDTPVYYISVDNNYSYYHPELYDFIHDSDLIEEERD